jgi:putative ABC transport system permease protein
MVIGVVEDTKNLGVGQASRTELYFLLPQTLAFGITNRMSFVVRADSGSAASIASGIRSTVREPGPERADISTPNDDRCRRGFTGAAAIPFAFAWLIFCYSSFARGDWNLWSDGVFSDSTNAGDRGSRCIGWRLLETCLAMVVGEGLRMTLVGLTVGLAGAFALTRLMATLLFEVSATDPATFVMVGLCLSVVGLLACFVPARRAAKVDPMVALRYE